MSQSDPTDNALAAIASILDQPPVIPRERERPAPEDAPATPPPLEEYMMPPPLEYAPPLEMPPPIETPPPLEAHVEAPALQADGYFKVGPGPMAAIRFKWAVRETGGEYYVDETIGESIPIVTGPMTQDAAIRFVDEHEAAARHRFELLKSEMAGRTAAANLVRKDSGEA